MHTLVCFVACERVFVAHVLHVDRVIVATPSEEKPAVFYVQPVIRSQRIREYLSALHTHNNGVNVNFAHCWN